MKKSRVNNHFSNKIRDCFAYEFCIMNGEKVNFKFIIKINNQQVSSKYNTVNIPFCM